MKTFFCFRNMCWLLLLVPFSVATQDTSLSLHEGTSLEASALVFSGDESRVSGRSLLVKRRKGGMHKGKGMHKHKGMKKRGGGGGGTVAFIWAQGVDIAKTVRAGTSIQFKWEAGPHGVAAFYNSQAPDVATFTRTQAALKAYVARTGQHGVSFNIGRPSDENLQMGGIYTPNAPFSLTITLTAKGLYQFTCPVHYGIMNAKINVV